MADGKFLAGERVSTIAEVGSVAVGTGGRVLPPLPEQSESAVRVRLDCGGEMTAEAWALVHVPDVERSAGPVAVEAQPSLPGIGGQGWRGPVDVGEAFPYAAPSFAGDLVGRAWRLWPTCEGYWWFTLRTSGGVWTRPVIVACHGGRVASLGSGERLSRAEVEAGGDAVRFCWASLTEPAPPGVE